MYRDLKPENLLIDEEGVIKLADFGISKDLSRSKRTMTQIGTLEYMPPEAFESNDGYGFKFDIWSYGCVLYELVVGHPPALLDHSQSVNSRSQSSHEILLKDYFSKEFSSLLKGLLCNNQKKRLSIDAIKKHEFFKKIDWDTFKSNTKIKPPFKPKKQKKLVSKQDIKTLMEEC